MANMLLGKPACVQRPRIPILTISLFIVVLFLSCKKGFNDYYGDESPKGGFLYNKLKADTEITACFTGRFVNCFAFSR